MKELTYEEFFEESRQMFAKFGITCETPSDQEVLEELNSTTSETIHVEAIMIGSNHKQKEIRIPSIAGDALQKEIKDCTKAIRLDPKHSEAYNNRGISYASSGQFEMAIQDFTEAIRLDPNHSEAYDNRGISYGSSGQFEMALEDFTEAIRLDPNDASAYYNRGLSYRKLGQNEKAIEDFTEAIRLDPGHEKAIKHRKLLLAEMN